MEIIKDVYHVVETRKPLLVKIKFSSTTSNEKLSTTDVFYAPRSSLPFYTLILYIRHTRLDFY